MDENGVVEEEDGPWGSLVVFSAKPHHNNAPWDEFYWWLCVSFRGINQVIRKFYFPIPWCDDTVEKIYT